MKQFLLVLILALLAAGCGSKLTFSEIGVDRVEKDVRAFVESVDGKNGVHLLFDEDQVVYVFMNGKNVEQGSHTIYFSDFDIVPEGDVLNIFYNEGESYDYSDKALKHQILYKVELDRAYDKIRLIKNGEEIPFGVVSGN